MLCHTDKYTVTLKEIDFLLELLLFISLVTKNMFIVKFLLPQAEKKQIKVGV